MITGIVASTSGILPAFTDEFVGSNGSSLPSKWSNIRGAWSIQSNKAATYSAANTYPLATFNANTKNVSLRAYYGQIAGGWGVAFWMKDENNWWAVVSEKGSFYGCQSGDTNNGDGTCYSPLTSYSYYSDYCTAYTAEVPASCGPDRTQDFSTGYFGGCGGYDAGGYNCNAAPPGSLLPGVDGCCYFTGYAGQPVSYGLPSGLTCESRCPGPCGPGGRLRNGGCYTGYTTCPQVPATWLMPHPAVPSTLYYYRCLRTEYGGNITYNATTYYTMSIKLIKMENGVVSQVATANLSPNTVYSESGAYYIQVVTNDAGRITATAQMISVVEAGQLNVYPDVAQIQVTPASPTRTTRHGIISAPVALGTQASTAENFVYSPV